MCEKCDLLMHLMENSNWILRAKNYLYIVVFGAIAILWTLSGLSIDGRTDRTLRCESPWCWHWLWCCAADAIRFTAGWCVRTMDCDWFDLLWCGHNRWCICNNGFLCFGSGRFNEIRKAWTLIARSVGHIAGRTQSFQIWWTVWAWRF